MRNISLFALLLAFVVPLAACEDDPTVPDPTDDVGAVSGTVMNQDGDGLLGVTLQVSGPQTDEATTDANGAFLVPRVPVGDYTVEITETPAEITCPDMTKSANVAEEDTAVVDWTCQGSQDTTTQTTARLTPGEMLPL